jgi:three-Cys-motif partner protein
MSPDTQWKLPDHSAAKHLLLRKYLEAWYPKLANTQRKIGTGQINYVDAFAGPGSYENGEFGSPLVALSTLVDHRGFGSWSDITFFFLFVEKDPERASALERRTEEFKSARPGGWPANVRTKILNRDFLSTVSELTELSQGGSRDLPTTFMFVDPFGFGHLPLRDLCELLKTNRCELLFNFMYEPTNRFVKHPGEKIQESIQMLFDTDEQLEMEGKAPAEREDFLHARIEEILSDSNGFEYVRRFRMEGFKGRTLCSLFFGTHHLEGLRVMKNAMWTVDATEGRQFSDRGATQPGLFDGIPDYKRLRDEVLTAFDGRQVSIDDLEVFCITETDFLEKHLKKPVLKPLEEVSRIAVVDPKPGRRRFTYPSGTILQF